MKYFIEAVFTSRVFDDQTETIFCRFLYYSIFQNQLKIQKKGAHLGNSFDDKILFLESHLVKKIWVGHSENSWYE